MPEIRQGNAKPISGLGSPQGSSGIREMITAEGPRASAGGSQTHLSAALGGIGKASDIHCIMGKR